MKVFLVDTFAKPPGSKFAYYAQLDPKKSDERFLDDDHFRGSRFPKKWRRVELHFSEPKWPRADFYHFGIGNFVCNERVRLLMGTMLAKAGEFLPLSIEGEKGEHYLYNVTDCGSFIDPIKSVWECDPGDPDELADPTDAILAIPAFSPKKIAKRTLFKIPEKMEIYCVQQNPAAKTDFKSTVERHKLTGLRFRLVWSENRGPVALTAPPVNSKFEVWKTGDGEDFRAR